MKYLSSQRFFRKTGTQITRRVARLNPKGTTRPTIRNQIRGIKEPSEYLRTLAKLAEAGNGVRPASLIELIVTSKCVGYIRSRGRAKKN